MRVTTERRLRLRAERDLGRRARGKIVAVDRGCRAYIVADDLDDLLRLMTGGRLPRRPADFYIFRLGERAAIELRIRR